MILEGYQHIFGLLLAFIATFVWRLLGLILAERLSDNGSLLQWVNSVAYAMVAGIMMMILVYPIGILASSTLTSRLLGFSVGILVVFFTKNLFAGIVLATFSFSAAVFFNL